MEYIELLSELEPTELELVQSSEFIYSRVLELELELNEFLNETEINGFSFITETMETDISATVTELEKYSSRASNSELLNETVSAIMAKFYSELYG